MLTRAIRTLILLLSALVVVAGQPNDARQHIELIASQISLGAAFGWSVSIRGDDVIVGAYLDDHRQPDAGAAFLFERRDDAWIEVGKLTASDSGREDRFGWAVAMGGGIAFVSAPIDDDRGTDSGSVYVFERRDGTWVEVQKLTASDGAEADIFGIAVSTSGDYSIVGAVQHDGTASDSGAAYVFERRDGTWVEVQKLTASDGAETDLFGIAVSIDGDTAIVGALGDDDLGDRSGSAYVFERRDGIWVEVQKLTASDGAEIDLFGGSVSLSGRYAIVASVRDDDNGPDSGSAYLFERRANGWIEVDKITASDGAERDEFGFSVALRGDSAIVGSWRDDDRGDGSGSAYVFERRGDAWVEVEKLAAGDGAAEDEFGVSVALDGEHAVVGAALGDGLVSDTGTAYAFPR